jgi:hypothetical protein
MATSKTGSKSKASSSTSASRGGGKTASTRRSSSGGSSSSARTTTDHNVIRSWVEARGGFPATVKQTHKPNDPGLLRIDFPGYSGEDTLERIGWDEWFKGFEENKLAFLYDDDPNSRFNKLISRDNA